MQKDIFIDSGVAKNFARPKNPEYKKLISWLIKYDTSSPGNNAHLVVSQKLIVEYKNSAGGCYSSTNIAVIVDRLMSQGRLLKKTNKEIKEFKQKHFTKKVEKKLCCNNEDRDYIPVIMLSNRQYALISDKNFLEDVINFPRFNGIACRKPQELPYA